MHGIQLANMWNSQHCAMPGVHDPTTSESCKCTEHNMQRTNLQLMGKLIKFNFHTNLLTNWSSDNYSII